MSQRWEMAVWGSPETLQRIRSKWPLDTHFCFSRDRLNEVLDSQAGPTFFIVVILDRLTQDDNTIMEKLLHRGQVCRVFICLESLHNGNFIHDKVQYTCNTHSTYKTCLFAISTFESSKAPQEIVDNTRRFLAIEDTVYACTVLIIGVNVSSFHMFGFQQQLIELCRRKFPRKEFIIFTIENCIPTEQFDRRLSKEQESFQEGRNIAFLENIYTVAPIIFLLGGNNDHLYNDGTPMLVGKLAADTALTRSQHQSCRLVEYEPIVEPRRKDLMGSLGFRWKTSLPGPTRLEELENDQDFFSDLQRSHDTIFERNQYLIRNFSKDVRRHRESTTTYSNNFHAITQADVEIAVNKNTVPMDNAASVGNATPLGNTVPIGHAAPTDYDAPVDIDNQIQSNIFP